jgi:hypothetical protein
VSTPVTAREGYLHESAPLLFGVGKAVFSADKTYRYRLSRTWGSSGTHATWIMLNPSTADAMEDDPTIKRCIAFTKDWGLDGLVVVNLFALRATDPRELGKHPDPVGAANDQFIADAIQPWSVAVAAWGAHAMAAGRANAVLRLVAGRVSAAGCLGVTAAGHPLHPLARGKHRVPAGTKLTPFRGTGDPMTMEVA